MLSYREMFHVPMNRQTDRRRVWRGDGWVRLGWCFQQTREQIPETSVLIMLINSSLESLQAVRPISTHTANYDIGCSNYVNLSCSERIRCFTI